MREPQRPRMTKQNTISKGQKFTNIVTWAVVIIAFVIVGFLAYENYTSRYNPEIRIGDTFLDIDGDGDIDYLIYGEVIMNCGGLGCGAIYEEPPKALPKISEEPLPTPEVFNPE